MARYGLNYGFPTSTTSLPMSIDITYIDESTVAVGLEAGVTASFDYDSAATGFNCEYVDESAVNFTIGPQTTVQLSFKSATTTA